MEELENKWTEKLELAMAKFNSIYNLIQSLAKCCSQQGFKIYEEEIDEVITRLVSYICDTYGTLNNYHLKSKRSSLSLKKSSIDLTQDEFLMSLCLQKSDRQLTSNNSVLTVSQNFIEEKSKEDERDVLKLTCIDLSDVADLEPQGSVAEPDPEQGCLSPKLEILHEEESYYMYINCKNFEQKDNSDDDHSSIYSAETVLNMAVTSFQDNIGLQHDYFQTPERVISPVPTDDDTDLDSDGIDRLLDKQLACADEIDLGSISDFSSSNNDSNMSCSSLDLDRFEEEIKEEKQENKINSTEILKKFNITKELKICIPCHEKQVVDNLCDGVIRSRHSSDEFYRLINLNALTKRKSSPNENIGRKKLRIKRKHSQSDDATNSDSSASSGMNLLQAMRFEDVDFGNEEQNVTDLNDEILDNINRSSSSNANIGSSEEEKHGKKSKRNIELLRKKKSPEQLKREKWKRNSLLTGKLCSESDTECSETEIINAKDQKPSKPKGSHASESDFEMTKPDSKSRIKNVKNSSDSDTSIGSIFDISDESNVNDSGEEEEGTSPQKGRRNIRSMVSDDKLLESTKKAKQEEEERTQRLALQSQVITNLSQDLMGEKLVLDIDKNTKQILISVHPKLTSRLKPHQKEGVKFMWNSCYESVERLKRHPGYGCILAHCMGLGKTFQVVALVHTLFTHQITNTKQVLVICPLSTVLNWENEFKIGLKGVPNDINVFLISEQQKDKADRYYQVEKWYRRKGVLVMGYEAYQSLITIKKKTNIKVNIKEVLEALVDPGPDLIICDEGHLLKNGKAIRTKSLMNIKTKRRIILSGTPLQNNLLEYYHMVQFVKPNLLGTKKEFQNRFVNPIENGQWYNSTDIDIQIMKKRTHVLHKLLKDTVQRYEVSELKSYLPDKVDYVLFVKLHNVQSDMYKTACKKMRENCFGKVSHLFTDFHQLMPIWTHPYLLALKEEQQEEQPIEENDTINLDPEVPLDNNILDSNCWKSLMPTDYLTNIDYGPKIKVALSIVYESLKLDEKVLLFSSSLVELDAVEHFLKTQNQWALNKNYYRMDGTIQPEKRHLLCNHFNNPKNKNIRLFLISSKVGGLGLNLVAASRVILMDVNWNPSYDSQSIFRAYRFGQTKKVFVYRLVSKGTMEEVVYERSIAKQAISNRVVDKMQTSRHFKSDDVGKIYRCELDYPSSRPFVKTPLDRVLAEAYRHNEEILTFILHQSLLDHLEEETLNEEEMEVAWREYNTEKEYDANILLMANQQSRIANDPQITTMVIPNTKQVVVGFKYDKDMYTLGAVIAGVKKLQAYNEKFYWTVLVNLLQNNVVSVTYMHFKTLFILSFQDSLKKSIFIKYKDKQEEELFLMDLFICLNENKKLYEGFLMKLEYFVKHRNRLNLGEPSIANQEKICDVIDLDNDTSPKNGSMVSIPNNKEPAAAINKENIPKNVINLDEDDNQTKNRNIDVIELE